MKPNIFLKNEHSCVQQEIALAHCQPIPDRKKDVIQKENCTTKCCYVHLPENSADTSHHLIFTMHPLSFKAVFFCNFIPHYSKEKGSFNPVSFERKLTLCSWCNNEDMVDIGLNTSLNWRSLRKQWLQNQGNLIDTLHCCKMSKRGVEERKRSILWVFFSVSC